MEQNEEKIAGTSLTVVPEYSQTAIGLRQLSLRLKGLVFDVTTKSGMKAAKEARAEARKLRTTLEAKRKEIKAPALERCRQIDEEAKRITGEIVALEEPIALQIENEEARAEAERLAELKREQDRVDAHKSRIQGYRDLPSTMIGWPSARIARALEGMPPLDESTLPDAEEFAQESDDAYVAARARIQVMLHEAKANEEQAERLKAQEAELAAARERMAQLEREAEERRQADERRAQEEREAAERKENERIDGLRTYLNTWANIGMNAGLYTLEQLERQQVLLKAENPNFSTVDFQEFHVEAQDTWGAAWKAVDTAIAKRKQEAADAEAQAEADRLERQRLADEAAESERKAVAAELERAHAAREAELARQDALTLRTASEALLQRVISAGHGTWQEAIDLGQVLSTSEGDVKPTKRQAAKPAKVAR